MTPAAELAKLGEAPSDDKPIQRLVTQHALSGKDSRCKKTLEIVLRNYGAACRISALWHLPQGGLFIAGGLAPKLLPMMDLLKESFLKGDGLMDELIASCPLHVVLDDGVGLLGAKVRAHILAQSSA